MTVRESPAADAGQSSRTKLGLRTDDRRLWTAVPVDATDDQRMCQWITVDDATLCALEEWR
jgi:hypothetical protein